MLNQRWYSELYLALAVLLLAWSLDTLGWLPALVPITLYLVWQLWQFRRLMLLLNQPDRADASEPAGFFGAIFDHLYRIRRQGEQQERQLRQRIQRFEESSASLPEGVVSFDRQGNIQWFNLPAGRLLGLTDRDLGQRIVNVVRNPKFVELFEDPGLSVTTDMAAPENDQQQLQLIKVSDGDHRSLLVIRDITQLRHLEQVRRDFVANASHELRTPLTVISGYLEAMVADEENLPPAWQQPVEQMGQQARRMQNIIADMLALAVLDGQQQIADDSDIAVDQLLEEVKAAAERLDDTHRLSIRVETGVFLRGAEKELHSALSNLVYNAVQHTPPGSEIILTWTEDDRGRGHLSVEDNGEGIPAEHLHRLTERFYRVNADRSRATGGTGLGLAIVKHIATLHDAELKITSELGQGSRFELCFPKSRLHPGKESDRGRVIGL
ncbi:MAG: phosphate regulon sensor histidine kinase PhoR [Gammaproteobacteria bacterium]